MKENSSLKHLCPQKKLLNQPQCKKDSCEEAKKLRRPECEIKNIRHNSEQGSDYYDSGYENKQKTISNFIDNAKSASSSSQVLHPLSLVQTQSSSASSHIYNSSHCNVTLNVAENHYFSIQFQPEQSGYNHAPRF